MLRKPPKYIKATKADIEKKVAASKNQTVYFIDDMDDAIVGMYVRRFRKSKKRPKPCNVLVAVYDADLCIQCLAKMFAKDFDPDDNPEEMAQEWFDYNTLGSLPNLYERMPIILMHDGEDTLQLVNYAPPKGVALRVASHKDSRAFNRSSCGEDLSVPIRNIVYYFRFAKFAPIIRHPRRVPQHLAALGGSFLGAVL